MANKKNNIIIRVNDIDLAIIKQKAELSQMSVSEYLRTAGTQRKVDGFSKSEMSIQNGIQSDVQIDGQMSIQDVIQEEPKQEEKKAVKPAKTKATKTATTKRGGKKNAD